MITRKLILLYTLILFAGLYSRRDSRVNQKPSIPLKTSTPLGFLSKSTFLKNQKIPRSIPHSKLIKKLKKEHELHQFIIAGNSVASISTCLHLAYEGHNPLCLIPTQKAEGKDQFTDNYQSPRITVLAPFLQKQAKCLEDGLSFFQCQNQSRFISPLVKNHYSLLAPLLTKKTTINLPLYGPNFLGLIIPITNRFAPIRGKFLRKGNFLNTLKKEERDNLKLSRLQGGIIYEDISFEIAPFINLAILTARSWGATILEQADIKETTTNPFGQLVALKIQNHSESKSSRPWVLYGKYFFIDPFLAKNLSKLSSQKLQDQGEFLTHFDDGHYQWQKSSWSSFFDIGEEVKSVVKNSMSIAHNQLQNKASRPFLLIGQGHSENILHDQIVEEFPFLTPQQTSYFIERYGEFAPRLLQTSVKLGLTQQLFPSHPFIEGEIYFSLKYEGISTIKGLWEKKFAQSFRKNFFSERNPISNNQLSIDINEKNNSQEFIVFRKKVLETLEKMKKKYKEQYALHGQIELKEKLAKIKGYYSILKS